MKVPFRVTDALLQVLRELNATEGASSGFGMAKSLGLAKTSTYRALENLVDAGWAIYWWEAENPHPTKPRRRLFQLTTEGRVKAQALIAEREAQGRSVGQALRTSTQVLTLLTLIVAREL